VLFFLLEMVNKIKVKERLVLEEFCMTRRRLLNKFYCFKLKKKRYPITFNGMPNYKSNIDFLFYLI